MMTLWLCKKVGRYEMLKSYSQKQYSVVIFKYIGEVHVPSCIHCAVNKTSVHKMNRIRKPKM